MYVIIVRVEPAADRFALVRTRFVPTIQQRRTAIVIRA